MNSIVISRTVSPPWVDAQPVLAGRVLKHTPSPDRYVLISREGEATRRVDLYGYADEAHAFEEAALWVNFAAIGFGERLYLIHLASNEIVEFKLDGYFGHLFATDKQLLVASAGRVIAISTDGKLLWQSPEVGIDGVVFHEADEDEVHGSGEWDPPGGWKEFRLCARTGRALPTDA